MTLAQYAPAAFGGGVCNALKRLEIVQLASNVGEMRRDMTRCTDRRLSGI